MPDFELVERLVKTVSVPIIAEGGISTPEELKRLFDLGIYSAVVGSAITRPMDITKKFIQAIE
ncbi:putative N-acetylmannosamine-6-phosphate 2-epimerase [compost metagenome]